MNMVQSPHTESGDDVTVADLGRLAQAFRIRPSLLLDYDHTASEFKAGRGLPDWADTYSAVEEDLAMIVYGDYGRVQLRVALVYPVSEWHDIMPAGITAYIDDVDHGEMTPQELRELAADLYRAADAIERSTAP